MLSKMTCKNAGNNSIALFNMRLGQSMPNVITNLARSSGRVEKGASVAFKCSSSAKAFTSLAFVWYFSLSITSFHCSAFTLCRTWILSSTFMPFNATCVKASRKPFSSFANISIAGIFRGGLGGIPRRRSTRVSTIRIVSFLLSFVPLV